MGLSDGPWPNGKQPPKTKGAACLAGPELPDQSVWRWSRQASARLALPKRFLLHCLSAIGRSAVVVRCS